MSEKLEGGAVYTHLGLKEYNERKDGGEFNERSLKVSRGLSVEFFKGQAADMFVLDTSMLRDRLTLLLVKTLELRA